MYWQDPEKPESDITPATVVNLSFRIECRELPIDHAWSLSQALLEKLPWIEEDERTAIHQIHIAESGNGWIRDDSGDGMLQLSRRCRLRMRVANERIEDALKLYGQMIEVDGYPLTIGASSQQALSNQTTLQARYVIDHNDAGEHSFIEAVVKQLTSRDIAIRKLMCGRTHLFSTPTRLLKTRSVMLADLSHSDSLRLQEKGFSEGRLMGLGIFIPHKGIDPVTTTQDDSVPFR